MSMIMTTTTMMNPVAATITIITTIMTNTSTTIMTTTMITANPALAVVMTMTTITNITITTDEVFTSWGMETAKTYTAEEIQTALEQLEDAEKYGMILRAKGIVAGADGKWIHFDYVPGTPDVRTGSASTTGRLCVIGSHIQEDALAALFRTC